MNRILPLNLLLGALIAAATGMILSDLAAYRLGRFVPREKEAKAVRPATATEDLSAYAPVVEKGLFGKGTAGKLTPLAPGKGAASPLVPAAAQPPSAVVLLGTAIGSFRETFALVRKSATGEERVFRLGEKVFDVGPLLAVHKESIVVSVGGKRTTIVTPASPGGAAEPAASNPHPQGQGGSSALAVPVGAGSYVIDQRGLNAALDDIGKAMTDARLLPYTKEGKVEGFRASEVKPQGIFGMVGIRNGDILLRVNDFPIDSPERAIQSLASLKGQNRLKLDLIRDGQPATFNYDIR